jgi:exodeoxyribonuclease-3
MKIITWNVNGFRAILEKGFREFMMKQNPDIICLQEIKMQQGQASLEMKEYFEYYCFAEKKGYSGTAIFTKIKPLTVLYNYDESDDEGRAIILEFEKYFLICEYTPNSKEFLLRLSYRIIWEEKRRALLKTLNKPIILCGDLNVAHQEIDLANPKENTRNPGFSIEERTEFDKLLKEGLIDAFRFLYPKRVAYTWWSYKTFAREKNIGWRIDYFVISNILKNQVKDVEILADVFGSDHCPVMMKID